MMQSATSMMQPEACAFSVASEMPYKFTGKERDTESGLDNFDARYDASRPGPVLREFFFSCGVGFAGLLGGNFQSQKLAVLRTCVSCFLPLCHVEVA
jgi:hypothetical protein